MEVDASGNATVEDLEMATETDAKGEHTPTKRRRVEDDDSGCWDMTSCDDPILQNALDGSPVAKKLKKKRAMMAKPAKTQACYLKGMKPTHWIEHWAKKCFLKMKKEEFGQLVENIEKFSNEIDAGSMCSGSEVQEVVANKVIGLINPDKIYNTRFVCDKGAMQLKFISSCVHADRSDEGSSCCKFKEIDEMANARAACVQEGHETPCVIPRRLKFTTCAWSCRDFSKRGLSSSSSLHARGHTTFGGMMKHLKLKKPLVYIGENLEEVVREDTESAEFLDKESMLNIALNESYRTSISEPSIVLNNFSIVSKPCIWVSKVLNRPH